MNLVQLYVRRITLTGAGVIHGQNRQNQSVKGPKAHHECRALQRVVAIHQRGVKDVVAVVNVAVVADDGAARSFVGRIVEMTFSLSKYSFFMERTLLFLLLLSLASAKTVSRGGDDPLLSRDFFSDLLNCCDRHGGRCRR